MKIFAASKKTPNLMHFMGLLRFSNIFFKMKLHIGKQPVPEKTDNFRL